MRDFWIALAAMAGLYASVLLLGYASARLGIGALDRAEAAIARGVDR